MFPRRTFLSLLGSAAMWPLASRGALADNYPSRPPHIVSGFPPGGISDTYARLTAQWLSEHMGQQFIVENRTGAGGNLAAESVARSDPDGYTLLLTTSADAWNTTLYVNNKFNLVRDLVPIGTVSRGPGVLVVHPSLPVKTVPELIAYVKENPGKVTMASAGIGSAPHRSPGGSGAIVFRHHGVFDRADQRRQAAGAGGDGGQAPRGAA
jgi:tripartite-type tricarboxylate transporter receptor subunit TctC